MKYLDMCGNSGYLMSILISYHSMLQGQNVSTTPLRQWGFRQCLPFSWTTLRDKHCRHPIAVMGVVDTFEHRFLWAILSVMNEDTQKGQLV